jgi:Zn-dependent protease/predicted transcriptional regulator
VRSWSISAGRFFGIDVRIHITFLFLLIFVWMTESAPHGTVAGTGMVRGLGLLAVILACVVLHEIGHAAAALHSGLSAKSLILLPIGGITILDESKASEKALSGPFIWRRDIGIALAGPLASFLVAVVAGGIVLAVAPEINLWMKPSIHSNHLLRSFVWGNVYLGLINLLPAYPLDGGRILRDVFSRRLDLGRATRRAITIGQTLATLLMLVGMMKDLWLTMVGVFVFFGAQLEERSAIFHSVLERVRLEDIMLTEFATLSPADTLEDALEKAVHSLQDDFPVVRGNDMVGVISKQKILDALRVEGNGYVQAVMNRIFEVASRQESLASAFRKLTARNLSIIPVVEDQHLVGIVTLQNLMHSMALLAESRKLRREALNP